MEDRWSAPTPELRTERLLLRPWREADLEPFAALNADPVVMELFPSTLDRSQSAELVDRFVDRWRSGRPSLWAVEVPSAGFIGFVGLLEPSFTAPFTPCVEVGWRLAAPWWGRGFATEGARAALAHGFGPLGLERIVSFTSTGNTRSRRVMEKLGLHHNPAGDFDHPSIDPVRSPHLVRHVLYMLTADEWAALPTGR